MDPARLTKAGIDPRARRFWKVIGAGAAAFVPEIALAEETVPPVRIGATYVSDSFANVTGGRERGFRQMGLLDVTLEVDDGLFGIEGAQAFVDLQFVHGQSLSGDLVGDGQVVSNIDATDALRPFEAWVALPVARKGYVKAGLIDLNGEFDVQSVGALFLNSSHGIGPDFSQSGLNGPSIFPTTSTAFVAGWRDQKWSARAGIFDSVSGDPDRPRKTIIRFPGTSGLLMVGEVDIALGNAAEFQIGGWMYTSRFDALAVDADAFRRRGNRGAYAMLEGKVGSIAGNRVDAWGRVGVAEADINPVEYYAGGGLGIGSEKSRAGIAFSYARLGDPAVRAAGSLRPERAEANIELTYRRSIGDRLVLQPDVQYIINPGWDPGFDDALVVGLRIELSLF